MIEYTDRVRFLQFADQGEHGDWAYMDDDGLADDCAGALHGPFDTEGEARTDWETGQGYVHVEALSVFAPSMVNGEPLPEDMLDCDRTSVAELEGTGLLVDVRDSGDGVCEATRMFGSLSTYVFRPVEG